MRILELGSGPVPAKKFISTHGGDVVFVDAKQAQFDYKKLFPGSTFYENTRYEDFVQSYDGVFDYILALNVLNAPNAGLIAHAGKLALLSYNLLANGGKLIMEVTYDGGSKGNANVARASVAQLGLYETQLYYGQSENDLQHFVSDHVARGDAFSLHATKI